MKNPVFGLVKEARAEAHAEARACYPWIRSRGTYLCTKGHEGQCKPNIEAECPDWKGTWREVEALIAKVKAEYPGVTGIYISGGYDGADTKADLFDYDNYEPWVSAWAVDVWDARKGLVVLAA